MNKIRPILITGKSGTGKSTMAKSILPNAIVVYANEMELDDWQSVSVDNGIIIEDVNYKPKKDSVLNLLRRYRGQLVLTSLNEKDVPSEIKAMCKIKRAGTKKWSQLVIKEIAPRSEEPTNTDLDTYSLVMKFLKEPDRDVVSELLKENKPSDTQILTWIVENLHPNKLLFVDGVVKRRWSQDYFYEMLSYCHIGNTFGRVNMPKRGAYSKIPSLLRRLGVKNADLRIFRQLKQDEDFVKFAKTKLNNGDCRILGLGEKTRRKKTDPVRVQRISLEEYI